VMRVSRVAREGSRKMCRLDGQGSRRCLHAASQEVKTRQENIWLLLLLRCYLPLPHVSNEWRRTEKIQLCDWRKENVEADCWQFQGNIVSGFFWPILWLAPIIQEKGSTVVMGYC
jgi:hypothetical protein